MNVATDTHIIQTHFEKIMSTDTDGCIKLVWGLEERTIGPSLIKKIELIISLRGFIKGYDESNGRWMRKEDLLRIVKEDPQWLRTNLVAQEYGI
jgi:hypothetical protein